MTVYATTRRFRPSNGTDWAPTVEEVTSIVIDAGIDPTPPASTSRTQAESVFGQLHNDGLVGVFIHLEARHSRSHLSIGSVAGSAAGGSLDLAVDALGRFASMWGTTLPQRPWTRPTRTTRTGYVDTIKFHHSPGLGIDWSGPHWSWEDAIDTIADTEHGTLLTVSFLSTTDATTPHSATADATRPLSRLWTPDLTVRTPTELSDTKVGYITTRLCNLQPWQVAHWLDTDADRDAAALGIPIIGGSRPRRPGTAITTTRAVDLLGFAPIQLRLEYDT